MKLPKVQVIQKQVDHAVGMFVAILCDEEFLKRAVAKNTADLPEELRAFVSDRLMEILHEIRDVAMEEVSEHYKKEEKT